MASVTQLVRFRMLLDELKDFEFSRFLTELTTKCGRNIICTALFNHFSDQKQTTSNQQILENMTTITEDIIRGRKPSNHADDGPPATMQSLSTVMIGEIASYLELRDYVSFTRCQRATYIGCTSPCTLRRLNLINVEDYRLVDLCKYPQIRFLALDLGKFNDLILPKNQNICKHLDGLQWSNSRRNNAEIEGLLNQTALPFVSITHLKFNSFGDGAAFFPANKMMKLLSKFPNTQCLSVYDVHFDLDESSTSQLLKHLPELTVLVARWCIGNCLNRMISVFGKQLKALDVTNANVDILQRVRLKVIEEVCVCWSAGSGSTTMDAIRRSTKSLKRIYFGWEESDESFVIDLLAEQKELEQLIIDVRCEDIQEVCGALDRGIFNIRKIEKKIIMIKLSISGEEYNTSDIMYSMSRVVNTLKSSEIEQFLFRCILEDQLISDFENFETELKYFKEKNSSQCDVLFNDSNIVVTNKRYADNECAFACVCRGWLTFF